MVCHLYVNKTFSSLLQIPIILVLPFARTSFPKLQPKLLHFIIVPSKNADNQHGLEAKSFPKGIQK